MTQYSNENRGVLFGNNRKTNPNHPDFTGNVVLSQELILHATREIAAGREPKLALSGWNKQAKSGSRFMSLSVDVPYEAKQGGQPRAAKPAQSSGFIDSDDIPF